MLLLGSIEIWMGGMCHQIAAEFGYAQPCRLVITTVDMQTNPTSPLHREIM